MDNRISLVKSILALESGLNENESKMHHPAIYLKCIPLGVCLLGRISSHCRFRLRALSPSLCLLLSLLWLVENSSLAHNFLCFFCVSSSTFHLLVIRHNNLCAKFSSCLWIFYFPFAKGRSKRAKKTEQKRNLYTMIYVVSKPFSIFHIIKMRYDFKHTADFYVR